MFSLVSLDSSSGYEAAQQLSFANPKYALVGVEFESCSAEVAEGFGEVIDMVCF